MESSASPSSLQTFLSFSPYFKPYRKRIVAWFGVYAAYFVLGIFTPLAVKFYFDTILPQKKPSAIVIFAGLYGLYAVFYHFFYLLGARGTAKIIEYVLADLRAMVYEKLHRLSIRYFDRNLSGEITNKVTGDTHQLLHLIGQDLVQAVLQLGNALLCLTILMVWNWKIGVVVLAFVPVYAKLFQFFLPLIRKSSRVWRRAEDRLWGNWGEKLPGIGLIQAFARERHEERLQYSRARNASRTWSRIMVLGYRMNGSGSFTAGLSQHAAWALGCLLLLNGELQLGALVSLAGLIGFILAPVQSLFNVVNTWQQSVVSAERIQKMMKEVEEVSQGEKRRAVGRLHGDVSFDHVWFEYEKNTPVLKDVHFSVKAGQSVALVGHTGCGKTTLMSLLQGFYSPQKGTVLVDGMPLDSLSPRDLRNNLGVVSQDVLLFSDSLRANLGYGRPEVTEQDLWKALEAAQAADFVRALAKGLDTRIGGEEGVHPSEGEGQRLAVARALMRDPAIIILDEATASLDSIEEEKIQKAMHALFEGRTSFIIAHRLSTVRHCDLVVMLENGVVLEVGAPSELLGRADSAYARLHGAHFGQAGRGGGHG